jgi:UDP-GlcNAc:undecaprenyl-phosphate/decaprenyl-phosphate GlcNAc-1-phosphate transferase
MIWTGVIAWFGAGILSIVLTRLTISLFHKYKWLIDPKTSYHPAHIHTAPVPKGGGLPVFLSILIVSGLFVTADKYWWALILASVVTLVTGLLDDIWGLSPRIRLVMNLVATLVIVSVGIGIEFLSNPAGGVLDLAGLGWSVGWGDWSWTIPISYALTIIWIPMLMNAINFSSGVDGQASGVVAIAAFFLALTSMTTINNPAEWSVFPVAMVISGAFAGLTWWHKYPQKIMPGYSATTLAGLWLGALSVMSTSKLGIIMVVLAIPLADFVYLIFRRLREKRLPIWGDKNHFHHFLLSQGWTKPSVAWFYWLATISLGVLSMTLETRGKIACVLLVLLIMLIMRLWRKQL